MMSGVGGFDMEIDIKGVGMIVGNIMGLVVVGMMEMIVMGMGLCKLDF